MTMLELVPIRPRSGARRWDMALVTATGALAIVGLGFVSIATTGEIDLTAPHVVRQATALILGACAAAWLAVADHRRAALVAPVLYVAVLIALAVVLVAGPRINGARAWLVFGPVQFQPSEVAKVAVIMMLASLAQERRDPSLDLPGIVTVVLTGAVPMSLILLQPDFGTFLVFVALTGVVLLVAGARVRHLVVLTVLGLAAVGLAWQLDLVEDYQVERLAVFLDADASDPQGAGYNLAQAQIAVGAGGLFGRGLQSGEQSALGFVPENHTDFIFTVIAEETGFAGAVTLLGLYVIVLWRGLRIAVAAPDMLGTLLAAGAVATFAVQVFVSIGMTVGLVPVIGLPLPLVSYGGTNLVASLAMVGLLLGVHRASR